MSLQLSAGTSFLTSAIAGVVPKTATLSPTQGVSRSARILTWWTLWMWRWLSITSSRRKPFSSTSVWKRSRIAILSSTLKGSRWPSKALGLPNFTQTQTIRTLLANHHFCSTTTTTKFATPSSFSHPRQTLATVGCSIIRKECYETASTFSILAKTNQAVSIIGSMTKSRKSDAQHSEEIVLALRIFQRWRAEKTEINELLVLGANLRIAKFD